MELIATNQIANFTFNHYSGANREVVSISIDGEPVEPDPQMRLEWD